MEKIIFKAIKSKPDNKNGDNATIRTPDLQF